MCLSVRLTGAQQAGVFRLTRSSNQNMSSRAGNCWSSVLELGLAYVVSPTGDSDRTTGTPHQEPLHKGL